MLLERAELNIRPGQETAFAAMMAEKGLAILEAQPGVRSATLGRGVENASRFLLLVEWLTMEDHTAFTREPVFADFRALLVPYSEGGAMEHFEMT